MTDTEAWVVVAAAFDKPVADRSDTELELTECGLCWAFAVVSGRSHMYIVEIFKPLFDYELLPWPWRGDKGWTPACDAARATFACFMAALTPAKRAELLTATISG